MKEGEWCRGKAILNSRDTSNVPFSDVAGSPVGWYVGKNLILVYPCIPIIVPLI